jgi:hypothetical protein
MNCRRLCKEELKNEYEKTGYLFNVFLQISNISVHTSGCEADRSPPSSAEVKNAWSYNPLPQYVFMAWLSTGTTLPLPLPLL